MQDLAYTLIPVVVALALGAVVVVLLLGVWNMMRGKNTSRSQNLMRWRVGLQLVAVSALMAALYFTNA
ncbi:MAG: twin transmembrane helix small protein [Alphaproteobacteria bacterium]